MKETLKDLGTAALLTLVSIVIYCLINMDKLPVQWPGHP